MDHSVCLNYFKHENPQKHVEKTPKREITVQTSMFTSHTLPVYVTQIPKLLKFCIRNSFISKESLLPQRPTVARFSSSSTARSLLCRNSVGGWGNHSPYAVLSAHTELPAQEWNLQIIPYDGYQLLCMCIILL